MTQPNAFLFTLFSMLISSYALAQPAQFTEQDRQMLQSLDKRLAVLEATLKEFKESVDKRFEQVDKRFEQVDKRFEDVHKRLDLITRFMEILAAVFTAIAVATIGFAIWDRRTALKPVEQRIVEFSKVTEEEGKEIETLKKEVTRLAQEHEELKARLSRANL
jgi:peptidoglycan hydrolase CwlO-like protein